MTELVNTFLIYGGRVMGYSMSNLNTGLLIMLVAVANYSWGVERSPPKTPAVAATR